MFVTTARNARCSGEKRLLILNGSPHVNGPVAAMCRDFCAALPPQWATEEYRCYDESPQFCDDCGWCRTHNGCVKHDLDALFEALEEADGLLLATPIHNRSFSAPLKTLIDRTQRYWAARFVRGERPPIARAKRVVLLTASGSGDLQGGAMVESQLRPPLTVLHATLVAAVHGCGMDQQGQAADAYRNEVAAAAWMLAQSDWQ